MLGTIGLCVRNEVENVFCVLFNLCVCERGRELTEGLLRTYMYMYT